VENESFTLDCPQQGNPGPHYPALLAVGWHHSERDWLRLQRHRYCVRAVAMPTGISFLVHWF